MGRKKKATMMDVAGRAGVSIATVARVLHGNGYVSQEKRRRIEAAVAELGYSAAQKEQPPAERDLVGVLAPPAQENPFFPICRTFWPRRPTAPAFTR